MITLKKLKINDIFIGLILFLFSMNFINMESRLVLVLFLSVFLLYKCICIPKKSILLILFSILFYIISVYYHREFLTYYVLPYLLAPTMGYLVGSTIINKCSFENLDNMVRYYIFIIVFGRFTHGFMNMIISGGFVDYNRNGMDIWTNSVIAATGQGALMSLCISLLFYMLFVVNRKNNFKMKIILFIAVIFAIYNSLVTASRTALIIMIIVFVVNIFCTVIMRSQDSKLKIKRIFKISIFVVIAVLLYSNNAFQIKERWENTPLYERISDETGYQSGDEYRKESLFKTIEEAYKYPFGDGSLDTTHNLWFDVLKQVGWFPFILLVTFTVVAIHDVLKIVKNSSILLENKYLILSICCAFLINFFVEPVFKGMPYYFVDFCIFAGMLNIYAKRKGRYYINIRKDDV